MNQELLLSLEQEADGQVFVGLSDDEIYQARQLFTELLSSVLESISLTPVQQQNEIAKLTGKGLIRKVASVPADKRVEFLKKQVLANEIRKLDVRAFSLARQTWSHPDERKKHIAEAQAILAELERYKAILAQDWPDQRDHYAPIFSEIALDSRFVINPAGKTSLRLGRLIKASSKQ